MQKYPKIFSSITFKILSINKIDEDDKDYIDLQIKNILTEISYHMNINYGSIDNHQFDNIDKISKMQESKLNNFINNFNRNSANRIYLWLDEEFCISEQDLHTLTDIYDEDQKVYLEIINNIRDNLIVNSNNRSIISSNTFYYIFSICLFLRESPIIVIANK